RVPQEHRVLVALPPFSRAFRDAARLIVDVPAVRTLIGAGVACEVFAFSHMSALPLFAQNVLAAGAEGLGTLNAAVAVGGPIALLINGAVTVAAAATLLARAPGYRWTRWARSKSY